MPHLRTDERTGDLQVTNVPLKPIFLIILFVGVALLGYHYVKVAVHSVQDTVHAAKEKVVNAKDAAYDALTDKVPETASEGATGIKDKLGAAYEAAKERVAETFGSAENKANKAKEKAEEKFEEGKKLYEDL